MICPSCSFDNIDGVDVCAECEHDLTFLDTDPTVACEIERVIMEQPVSMLQPPSPICVRPNVPLKDVVKTLIDARIGCVLIVDGGDLVGIFTERDLLLKIAGREDEVQNQPVGDWMTRNPEVVERDDSIALGIHKIAVGRYRHLPVMEHGRPVGIISVRDMIRFLTDQLTLVQK